MHTTVEWNTNFKTNIWLLVANNYDKLSIWHYVWSTHVIPSQGLAPLSSPQLALTSLSPPASSSPNTMFAITVALEPIWLSHFAFIFKDTPFQASQVEALIDKLIHKAQQGSFLSPNIPTHLSLSSTPIDHCSEPHVPLTLDLAFYFTSFRLAPSTQEKV